MRIALLLAPIAAIGLSSPVAAWPYHHHRHATAARHAFVVRADRAPNAQANQEPIGGGAYNPYAHYTGPGSAVLNATVRAAGEPGVTLELAPDAKETATGGPVGGPPGFDGS